MNEITSFPAEKLPSKRVASQAMHVRLPRVSVASRSSTGIALLPGWGASTLLALRAILMTANALAVATRLSSRPPRQGGLLALFDPDDGLLDGVAALWRGATFCAGGYDEAGEWDAPKPGAVLLFAITAPRSSGAATSQERVLAAIERLRGCSVPFVLCTCVVFRQPGTRAQFLVLPLPFPADARHHRLVLGDVEDLSEAKEVRRAPAVTSLHAADACVALGQATRSMLTRLRATPVAPALGAADELAAACATSPLDRARLRSALAAARRAAGRDAAEATLASALKEGADRNAAADVEAMLCDALRGPVSNTEVALPRLREAAAAAASFAASKPAITPRVAADLNALSSRVVGRVEALQQVSRASEGLAEAVSRGAPNGGAPEAARASLRAALAAARAAPWPWQLVGAVAACERVAERWDAVAALDAAAAARDPRSLAAALSFVREAFPEADTGAAQAVADTLAAEGALRSGDTRLVAYANALAASTPFTEAGAAICEGLRASLRISGAEHEVALAASGRGGSDAPLPPPHGAASASAWRSVGAGIAYNEEALLGCGSRGTYVFSGRVALTSRATHPAAVKRISRPPGPAGRLALRLAEREVELLTQLAGPRVVALYGWAATSEHIFVATELCAENLAQHVARQPRMDMAARLRLMREAAEGVARLHAAGVAHNDLKPANLLIALDGRLKLADVGLGVVGLDVDTPDYSLATFAQYGVAVNLHGRAPEVLLQQRLTPASDVFSLGLVFFFILTGCPGPFSGATLAEVDARIKAGRFELSQLMGLGGSPRCALEARHLLASMLAPSPADRPSAAAVLRHPLFATSAVVLSSAAELHASGVGASAEERLSHRAANARARHGAAAAERGALLAAATCDLQGWIGRVEPMLFERLSSYPGARAYEDTLAGLLRFARNAAEHPPSGAEAAALRAAVSAKPPGRGVAARRALLAEYLLALFPTLGIAVAEASGEWDDG